MPVGNQKRIGQWDDDYLPCGHLYQMRHFANKSLLMKLSMLELYFKKASFDPPVLFQGNVKSVSFHL